MKPPWRRKSVETFRMSQPTFTCSKSTVETLEKGGKYVKS